MVPFWCHAAMSNLTIKNLPASLHRRLKRNAAFHRRSLNNEVIALLEHLLPPEKPLNTRKFLSEVRKLRRYTEKHPATSEEIERAINEGRP